MRKQSEGGINKKEGTNKESEQKEAEGTKCFFFNQRENDKYRKKDKREPTYT